MNQPYAVKQKPLHCLIGIVAGGLFLFFGLDLMFFHLIDGATIGPKHPITIILTLVSGSVVYGSLKALISPKTLLQAADDGINLVSGGTDSVWNEKTKSFDVVRRENDTKLIPWDAVVDIGEGTIITGRDRVGGHKFAIAGGTATFGGEIRHRKAKALKVLCDKNIKIEGFDLSGCSKAWNGYTDTEVRQMSKQEREELTPDALNSGFVFHHKYLRGGLPGALSALKSLHQEFGQQSSRRRRPEDRA